MNSFNSVLWSVELGATPSGQMLAVGDLLLVPTQTSDRQSSALCAVSLADGGLRWQQSFEYALVSGLETLRVCKTLRVLVALSSTDVMHGEGALLALDTAGVELWHWSPGVQRVSAPAVVDDLVCVTADARTFVALDAATGAERARVGLDTTASLAAPALQTSEVSIAYIPCRGPHLLAVGLDGRPRWRFDVPDAPDAWLDRTPVTVGDRVFAVLSTGAVLALQAQDGMLLWQTGVGPGKRLSSPAADGERLYVGARDGVYALDVRDGGLAWAFPTGREVEAAPVVSGGVVYAVCHDHHLYALDAASGRVLCRREMERRIEVPPVLAALGAPDRACILVADRGGRLVALERPLSAAEHEAAGHWVEAASAYVESGQLARGAGLLAAHGYAMEAARLWKQAGELERAAEQYQAARAWQEAAELWATLERPLRQAEVLEHHARALDPAAHGDEERAAAWESAAQVFRAEGEAGRAFACQREAAQIRRQPLIQVQVEAPPAMSLAQYYAIAFELTNVGGGAARQVVLRHTQSEFAGDLQASRELRNVSPGQSVREVLSLRARATGEVPLEVSVTFADSAGRLYEVRHRTILKVRSGAAMTTGKAAGEAFADFQIRIFPRQDNSYPVEMTLGGEQVSRPGYLAGDVLPWVASGDLAQDGQRLLGVLLTEGSLRTAWDRARGQSPRCHIRLWVDARAPELHAVPWELLQEEQVMLSASADTPFSRYLPIWKPWGGPVEARPIRVLVAISNPHDLKTRYDLPPVDVALEQQTLREALANVSQAALQVDFLDSPVTFERLQAELCKGYHILHVLGHGAFSVKSQQAALYLQNENELGERVLDDALAGMLARQGVQPRLVFLSACQSATRSTTDAFLGLGPKLVSVGVPAVVAMQDLVTVTTARKFSAMFYRRLLEHGLVDLAMNEARSTLLTAGRWDAAVPVLFMRLRSGRLWAQDDLDTEQPSSGQVAGPAERSEWNTAAIRDLLTAAFDDEEIKTLCFDHFRPVYEDFASGMGKRDMIHRLVEHCVRHEQMQELLALARKGNPAQYARFQSSLKS